MRFEPVHPDVGVEVLDLDLAAPASESDVARLREALDRHQLLLIRGDLPLDPERQVEITSWFGPPVDNGGGKLWSVLHNKDAAGSIRLPYHSDLTYTDHPIRLISLHAAAVPPGGTATAFASGVRAWRRLSPELQALLGDKTLRHHYVSRVAADWPKFDAEHPVCKRHPRTGDPILFVTENHADRILELDAVRSAEVIRQLFDVLYAPEHVYLHRWRLYDTLIWDNLALQHARPKVAAAQAGERAMQRVAVSDKTFPELLAIAREQAARRAVHA